MVVDSDTNGVLVLAVFDLDHVLVLFELLLEVDPDELLEGEFYKPYFRLICIHADLLMGLTICTYRLLTIL